MILPKNIIENKFTLLLIFIIVIFLLGSFTLYQKFIANKASEIPLEEVDLPFDPEGPYALLYPRSDGNAMVLNLKRTGSYDKISYELAYVSKNTDASSETGSEEIDRGVSGDINTKDKRGEYEVEILFGTCSKNVCKYDTGIENGTLTLHIQKGKNAYRMITQWHLQKPSIALGKLISGDNHFTYQLDPTSNLSLVDYSIINDLSGAPKLAPDKQILGKVYGTNVPIAKTLPPGQVIIELAEVPVADSKIARFDNGTNKWIEVETLIEGSKLTAKLDAGGVITVLSPKK